jgi:hypothetical protein
VYQDDRAAVPRPFVDVVHPPVGRLKPAWLKRPQPPESPVRRHSWQNPRGRAEQIKDAQEQDTPLEASDDAGTGA